MTSGLRRKLLIVGASGFGREVLWVIEDLPAEQRGWLVAGFLDDNVDAARASLKGSGVHLPVLGAIRDHEPAGDEVFFCAIGGSRARLAVGGMLRARGAEFVNLVHPSARVHRSARTGTGLILGPLTTFAPGCTVGDFVVLNASANVGTDATVEDGCFLGARCDVMAGARLERGAFLGSHVTVHPGVTVGAFSTVGIGSVVLRRVPAGGTLLGVPARSLAF
jgi:sugar O-acyltransferase (sialic acid O-acetyltransferase NeuD family)